MAEVAALEIQIGAKVDQAVAGLEQFDKSLFELQNELKTFKAAQETTFDPKQFAQYGQKIQSITAQINNRFASMERSAEETSTALVKMNKTSSGATNSLFALSGIVQDAPYGFRAIANNITFFTQQVAYSSKEAGGFGKAIKAMGSAFIGPAGIIFAISAAVSLIDFFASKTKKAKDEVNALEVKVGDLNSALLLGSQNAQKDAVHLDLLYKAATDVNRSIKERIAAVRELQTKYPKYLGNLSQEEILAGKAATAYNNLRTQIIATARARAAQDTIIENEKQRLALEAKLQQLGADRNKLEATISATAARASSALSTNAQGYNSAAIGVTAFYLKLNNLNKEINETVAKYNELTAANLKLTGSVNATDLTTKFGGGDGKSKTAKNKTPEGERFSAINRALDAAKNSMREFTQQSSQDIANSLVPALGQVQKNISDIQPVLDPVNLKLEAMTEIVTGGLVQGFEGVFSAIANGANAFQSVIQAVEQLIIKLAAAAAVAAILSALTGGGSEVGAGITKLFGGGSFKKIFGGLTGLTFANGGIAYGPTRALVGEYPGARSNPEVIAPLDKLRNILGTTGREGFNIPSKIELTAKGTDLIAVMELQNSKYKSR